MNASRCRSACVVAVATFNLCGCAMLNARNTPDGAPSTWPTVLATSRQLASESRFDVADSMLADYAMHHPGSADALETEYWRALFKMDPSNHHNSAVTAMSSLDAYLADVRPREHVVEATTLRRIGAQLNELNKLAASAMAQAKDASTVAANAKTQAADAKALADTPSPAEAEVKRLKDELAKATSELERIRKRLSQPPPGKPEQP
ncbi:MAG: hypothetical protein ABJF01_10365 [bacterium]